MKQLTSATFRDTFIELEEPVEVKRYKTVIGTWFPTGTSIAPVAKLPGELIFGGGNFDPAPVPKPGKKK